jgi:hypothetical protein
MDVTRTVPRNEIESHIAKWFQGSKRGHKFPVKGCPRRLQGGDYLYIIWKGLIYGRLQVLNIEKIPLNEQPIVGSRRKVTAGTHNIIVEAPGECVPVNLKIKRRGHRGIRYDSVPEWP